MNDHIYTLLIYIGFMKLMVKIVIALSIWMSWNGDNLNGIRVIYVKQRLSIQ